MKPLCILLGHRPRPVLSNGFVVTCHKNWRKTLNASENEKKKSLRCILFIFRTSALMKCSMIIFQGFSSLPYARCIHTIWLFCLNVSNSYRWKKGAGVHCEPCDQCSLDPAVMRLLEMIHYHSSRCGYVYWLVTWCASLKAQAWLFSLLCYLYVPGLFFPERLVSEWPQRKLEAATGCHMKVQPQSICYHI